MKKSLSLLTIVFGILVLMMLPAGTMKAKAAGNLINGAITWDDIRDGSHVGDYVGKNTTITGYSSAKSLLFTADIGSFGVGGTYHETIVYNDFVKEFDRINTGDNKNYFYQNLTYNAFEIISDPYNNGDLYLKRVNITYPPEVDSGSSDTQCDHDYVWTTVNEATEDYEGLEDCRCTKCGAVCASRKIPRLSDNYNYVVEKETEKYVQAKSGQTIKIDLKDWNSIPKSFFEELAKRRDITTTIRFVYNHKVYEFTIERGQTVDTSVDYYGPEKLIQLYGAKEVVTK